MTRLLKRLSLPTLAFAAALVALPGTAGAAAGSGAPAPWPGADHAVFVQTDDLTANSVIAFHRSDDGSLRKVATYLTGGRGGVADQAPLDSLASQGALTYDPGHGLLLAVNAGSDSLTVFGVAGDRLQRVQVVGTRGEFPVSVAVHGDLVFVLDAGGTGAVSGYRIVTGRLAPLPWAHRSLGLANTDPPLFITAPAQIGFDPAGTHLVVTTKANGTLVVIPVGSFGDLGPSKANTSAGGVPFSFVFDRFGHLVVTEAAASTVSSYRIAPDGTLRTLTAAVPDGGAALCWNALARGFVYGANAGSGTLSSYRTTASGGVILVDAVAAVTAAGPIDLATAAGGRLLYVQDAVAGEVQGFRVGRDGSLTLVETVGGLPAFNGAGMEGLVAA